MSPLITLLAGSAIAVWGAHERHAAIAARTAAEAERRQLRLLAEAARITDGAADIDDALRRLVDLLVPDLADAAWIDVVQPGGGARRLAARVDGTDHEELEAWLLARGSSARSDLSPTTRALRGEGSQLAELDERLRVAIAHDDDPDDRRLMEQSELRWTMALPLAPSGGPLGALGLGVGRSGRRYGPAELAFAELLVGRAGLALANAQLVDRLTAAQRRLDGILGALAEAVTVQSAGGRIEYANEAAARLLGLPGVHAVLTADPGDLAGRFEIRHPDGAPVDADDLPGARVIRGERPEPLLTQSIYRATGELHWFLTKATPLEDEEGRVMAVNVIEDITEEHEARLRQEFLAEAGEALSSSLEYEETLQRVAQLAVPRLADWCAVELPDERGSAPAGRAGARRSRRGSSRRASSAPATRPTPRRRAARTPCMRSGEPQLIREVPDELLVEAAQDAEHLELIRALGIRSGMSVPMIAGGRVLGVMTFVFSDSARVYDEQDLVFAQDLAARAATAIENSSLYTERAEVARTLQASLLPEELPDVAGWRFAADYRPGQRGADVGGDFYDVFAVRGRADGAARRRDRDGRGGSRADLARAPHGQDRGHVRPAPGRAPEPRQRCAAPAPADRARDDGLRPAARGHDHARGRRPSAAAAQARRGRRARRWAATGLLLGAVDSYEEAEPTTIELAPGDTLLLFTDGVTDTPGPDSRFGGARLRAAVDAAPAEPAALLQAVSTALDEFSHGAGLDDRAMLALQRT